MISTLSEFETQLKGRMFQGHTGVRFAGVLYGVLMRLEGNGVSAQVLDDLLSESGFKSRGHYSRYLAQGFKYCDDLYAFERLVGEKDIPQEKIRPQFHPNRRKNKGLPQGVPERKSGNEILLQSPEEKLHQQQTSSVPFIPSEKDFQEHDMGHPFRQETGFPDMPLYPVENPVENVPEKPSEVPVEKPRMENPGGFQLKRAKKDDELVREKRMRPVNNSAIYDEEVVHERDNAGRSRLEESRRAGIPSSARKRTMGGDEF